MSIKAVICKSYRVRLGLLGGMFTFWFLYCMYDGYIAYPRQRLIAQEYAAYVADGKVEKWAQYARSRGWPDGTDGPPGKDHSDWNIYTQYIMGYGVLPVALLFSVAFFRAGGRWIAMDEQGLTTSWGQRVPFEAIASLDKSRWRSKGIAVVLVREGKNQRLVLDNFKFSPQEIALMVKEVQARLSPDQISGEPVEPKQPVSEESQPEGPEGAGAQPGNPG